MFSRILVAVDTPEESQAALDLVRQVATEGLTKVQVLHLRERELSGSAWYSREGRDEASYAAESAVFELRKSGLAARGGASSAPGRPGARRADGATPGRAATPTLWRLACSPL